MVGGYVDAVGYVMLRGLFPNHVTGNLPIAAAHGGAQVLPAILMVPLWLAAVVGVAAVAGNVRRIDPSRVLSTVLALEAALLGLFLVVGVSLVPSPEASTLLTQTIVTGAGVCAMAAQSVVSRLAGYPYPTTMVTGTLTLLGMDGAQVLFGQQSDDERSRLRQQVAALGRAVLAFAAGAGLGGLAVHRLHFWAITAPLLAVVVCAVKERAGGGPQADARPPRTQSQPRLRNMM